jgi:hypothetical protein
MEKIIAWPCSEKNVGNKDTGWSIKVSEGILKLSKIAHKMKLYRYIQDGLAGHELSEISNRRTVFLYGVEDKRNDVLAHEEEAWPGN